ncbi:hypothetical protein WMY93_029181 [Mugilogobius chulae]|uniref:Uncharacterized protein n=1 Tax=Mugilogobius chulae TaxID=88201 RepID=A0AAW0N0R3_9GOBI
MEITTQSSWDLRISALRRMNACLIDDELPKPKSIKAKQAKDRGSCTKANTSTWRQKTKRAAAPKGCSPLTMIHVSKPEPKVHKTEPSFDYELDFPALMKKELQHEENKTHDLFAVKTNSTKEFHLAHGGNLSTEPSAVKTLKKPTVQPNVRERYILPNFTREEAIDIFIKQSKPTPVSFVQADEIAPPEWPELIFPKRELYTISEVEDETDYTREEVLEMFLSQTKLETVNFVQGGNLAHIDQKRNPSFDPQADFPTPRKELEHRPEEKGILDLFFAKNNPTKEFHLAHGGLSTEPSAVKTLKKPTLQPIVRERYVLPNFTRQEAIDIFIQQSKPTPVSFVQAGEIAPPEWPDLIFPKRELYTIPEVEDETDYTREEVLVMFLGQTKLETVNFVQGGNLAHIDQMRNPSFEPEADLPTPRKELELRPEEKKILDLFFAKTNPTKKCHLVHGGNLSTVTLVQPSTVKTANTKTTSEESGILREKYIFSELTGEEAIQQSSPTPVSFVQNDEATPPAEPMCPELCFPKRELHTIPEVEDETNYTREEVLEMFLTQSKLATVNFVQKGNLADIVQQRKPPVNPDSDFPCSKRKDLGLRPEEKEILDLFFAKTKPTQEIHLVLEGEICLGHVVLVQ